MDFLSRLEMLMRIKGINKSELAAGSGIKKTTVYSWWDKGYEGITLPKLRALCAFFGCTLDWLVDGDEEGSVYLSADESALISDYRQLSPDGKTYIRQTMCMAVQAYGKNHAVPDLADQA